MTTFLISDACLAREWPVVRVAGNHLSNKAKLSSSRPLAHNAVLLNVELASSR